MRDKPEYGQPGKTPKEVLFPEQNIPVDIMYESLLNSQQSAFDMQAKQPGSDSSRKDEHILTEPNPPKVLMQDPDATPLEFRSQVQLYAMTEYADRAVV